MTDTNANNIDSLFAQAEIDVKQLPERPGNLTLLRLYALYKQATEGENKTDKPGITDMVGRYKYDAWKTLADMPKETAKQQYIELVNSLKKEVS